MISNTDESQSADDYIRAFSHFWKDSADETSYEPDPCYSVRAKLQKTQEKMRALRAELDLIYLERAKMQKNKREDTKECHELVYSTIDVELKLCAVERFYRKQSRLLKEVEAQCGICPKRPPDDCVCGKPIGDVGKSDARCGHKFHTKCMQKLGELTIWGVLGFDFICPTCYGPRQPPLGYPPS